MKQSEPCYIYQDLMPLHLEGLLSQESSRDLTDHLQTCPVCQAKYQALAAPIDIEHQAEPDTIDYLHRIKQKQRRKGLLIGLVVLCLAAISWLYYPSPSQSFSIIQLSSDGQTISLNGALHDSGKAFAYHRVKENDDFYDVTIYSMLVNPIKRSGQFGLSLPADKPVRLDGVMTIEPDGFVVTGRTERLFQKQTAYIGNNSLVGGLLQELIGIDYGGVTFEIDSAAEPYGLHIHLNRAITSGQPVEESFQRLSAVLLALIDNAEYISWHYHQGEDRILTIDLAQADQLAGRPVKQFAASQRSLQELMNHLGIKQ